MVDGKDRFFMNLEVERTMEGLIELTFPVEVDANGDTLKGK